MRPRLRWPRRRGTRIALIVLLALIVLVAIGSFFVDEPLRRTIESQMNDRLKGYSAGIGRLSFHPLGFGLTLYDVTFSQNAHPDPPVLKVAKLDASVEWKALLHARLVANFRLDRPVLYVDLAHLREEAKDPTPVTQHGWQEAFEAIYPLKIDEFVITNGEAQYVDPGPFKPLRITGIQLHASNIRNVRSRERDYPSRVWLQAVVFETGALTIEGNADFLAEPHVGVKANVDLRGVPLDYFKPVTTRYNLSLSGGTLSAEGLIEYAPTIKVVDLRSAEVSGVKIEYIHTPAQVGAPKRVTKATAEATKKAADRPDLLVRAAQVRVRQSEVGFTNKVESPAYRVFFTDVNLDVENVTNQRAEGIGDIKMTGRFMGSGRTSLRTNIRPTPKGPDFDLTLEVQETDMRTMNPLLRRYGKFDVVEGTFSLFSELHGKNSQVTGYVKPLFKNLKAYDPDKDRDKNFTQKLYAHLVDLVSKVLKNQPRREVATKIDVAGDLHQPQTSMLQAIGNLLRNAFIKAILPGLEREASTPSRAERKAFEESAGKR